MSRKATRLLISVVAGCGGFLLSFTYGCDDRGGVPSWERCISPFGTPVPEWSAFISLAVGIGVGAVMWGLLGFTSLSGARGMGTQPQPPQMVYPPMTPLKQRLIALIAIVITDEEAERIEGLRRSGYAGDITVTGRELTAGLPATGSVNTGNLWPPEDHIRQPART